MSATSEANRELVQQFNELLDLDGTYARTTDDLTWFSLSGRHSDQAVIARVRRGGGY